LQPAYLKCTDTPWMQPGWLPTGWYQWPLIWLTPGGRLTREVALPDTAWSSGPEHTELLLHIQTGGGHPEPNGLFNRTVKVKSTINGREARHGHLHPPRTPGGIPRGGRRHWMNIHLDDVLVGWNPCMNTRRRKRTTCTRAQNFHFKTALFKMHFQPTFCTGKKALPKLKTHFLVKTHFFKTALFGKTALFQMCLFWPIFSIPSTP